MQRTQLGGARCLSCETHAVILPTVSGVEWKSTEPGRCVRLFLVARRCGSQPVIVITDTPSTYGADQALCLSNNASSSKVHAFLHFRNGEVQLRNVEELVRGHPGS